MAIDPRTPVLVGTGSVHRRNEGVAPAAVEPAYLAGAAEAAALMAEAARVALFDTGVGVAGAGEAVPVGLASSIDWIVAMASMSGYADPAALVAGDIGATSAQTVLAEIGILQTTPVGKIGQAMLAGDIDMAILVGGEAKYRTLASQITGVAAPNTVQPEGTAPDQLWAPQGDIISPHEIAAGLITPVQQYAMLENARRAAAARSIEQHHRHVAELYAAFNEVAQDYPKAAYPEPKSADFLAAPSAKNRPLAFPYWKWHNSQWNVDQAAALVFCTHERADELGIAPERRCYPTMVVESNEMVPVGERTDLARSDGFEAIASAMADAGVDVGATDFVELYSCFPSAVQAQIDAFALPADRPYTVTGGMAFCGGPLNNFVLQGLDALTRRVRSRNPNGPAQTGLATAVSGMLTKQGASLWSSEPASGGFDYVDVSDQVVARGRVALGPPRAGRGTVVTYTVRYDESQAPHEVVALIEDGQGRFLASASDPVLAETATKTELIGRVVTARADATFAIEV